MVIQRIVDVSHVIEPGMTTYPGLPGPEVRDYMTRVASREHYAPGTEFQIGRVAMVGNTGTYIDTPFHRYAEASDLVTTPLDRMVELDGIVIAAVGRPTADAELLQGARVRGRAVLIYTGWSRHWGTDARARPIRSGGGIADRLCELFAGSPTVHVGRERPASRQLHPELIQARSLKLGDDF